MGGRWGEERREEGRKGESERKKERERGEQMEVAHIDVHARARAHTHTHTHTHTQAAKGRWLLYKATRCMPASVRDTIHWLRGDTSVG